MKRIIFFTFLIFCNSLLVKAKQMNYFEITRKIAAALNVSNINSCKMIDKSPVWGIRQIERKGFDYNTNTDFEYAYVIYYLSPKSNDDKYGVYFQTDAMYLRDVNNFFKKIKYEKPENSDIPMYCAIYFYCLDIVNDTLLNLCSPLNLKNSLSVDTTDIFSRKIFKSHGIQRKDYSSIFAGSNQNGQNPNPVSYTLFNKLSEYRNFNPDPIISNSYEILFFDTSNLKKWLRGTINKSLNDSQKDIFKDSFYQCLDTSITEFPKIGWAYLGKFEMVNGSEKFLPNFYFRNFGFYHRKIRRIKRSKSHQSGLREFFTSKDVLTPIYNLPLRDTIPISQYKKPKVISELRPSEDFNFSDIKLINNEYVWVQLFAPSRNRKK